MKIKLAKLAIVFSLLIMFSVGHVSAQFENSNLIPPAIYQDQAYIGTPNSQTNCELNGAWTSEYKYYWLPDQNNSNNILPDYIQSSSFRGVIQDAS